MKKVIYAILFHSELAQKVIYMQNVRFGSLKSLTQFWPYLGKGGDYDKGTSIFCTYGIVPSQVCNIMIIDEVSRQLCPKSRFWYLQPFEIPKVGALLKKVIYAILFHSEWAQKLIYMQNVRFGSLKSLTQFWPYLGKGGAYDKGTSIFCT